MVTFIDVPKHFAVVGGAPVTVAVAIEVDAPTSLELVDNGDGAYSFANGPAVNVGDTSITLNFEAHAVGASAAKLRAVLGAPSVELRGEGKAAVVFAKQRLEFPPGLVGDRDVAYVDATNNTDQLIELALEGADASNFELVTKSLSPANTALPVLVAFRPDARRDFQATIAARFNGEIATLDLTGSGVERLEEGFIEQTSANPAAPGAPTDRTRFSVYVPEHESHFNMGAASHGDAGTNRVNIAGIGLTTRERILLSATGEPAKSQAAVMAAGDVILQSNQADVLSLADKDNIVAAHGSAYVVGNAGVFIASVAEDTTQVGADGFPDPQIKKDGTPSTVKSAENAAIVFGSLDMFVATIGAGRAAYHAYSAGWTPTAIPPSLAAIAGVAAAVFSGCSAGGVLPTTTVYGHAGVLVGTPGFGSFYAVAGLVLASSFPVMLGFDTEIVGLHSVGMLGGKVGISSTWESKLHSHAKVTIKADGAPPLSSAKRGEVEIEAKNQIKATANGGYTMLMEPHQVTLGLPPAAPPAVPGAPAPPLPVAPPAPPVTPGQMALGDRSVRFTVAQVSVELTDTTITLSDGQGTVVVNNGGITMTGAQQEVATLAGGNITFNAPNAGAHIDLDAPKINLRAGGTNKFTMLQLGATGNAQLTGTRILLG